MDYQLTFVVVFSGLPPAGQVFEKNTFFFEFFYKRRKLQKLTFFVKSRTLNHRFSPKLATDGVQWVQWGTRLPNLKMFFKSDRRPQNKLLGVGDWSDGIDLLCLNTSKSVLETWAVDVSGEALFLVVVFSLSLV